MDVIVSMAQRKEKPVFHKAGCSYVKRMKPWNRMSISEKAAIQRQFCSCKRCCGLKVELETDEKIARLRQQGAITTDYNPGTKTLYVRTNIGCWKMFSRDDPSLLYLYHMNVYQKDMSLAEIMRGGYHRQTDVPLKRSLAELVDYIVAHDRAKEIIRLDYRKLPRATKRQRKYYQQAEKRNRRQQYRRLDELFRQIEAADPELKQCSIC